MFFWHIINKNSYKDKKTIKIKKENVKIMGKIKSPLQVARYDGKDCFFEIMIDSLSNDNVRFNFCSYNINSAVGSRLSKSISFLLSIEDACVLSIDILNGTFDKLSKVKRADAEAKGSSYPDAVFTRYKGTRAIDSKRDDGKPESRQFLILPGNKKPWVVKAVKGPGVESSTGLISPCKGTCEIVQVPLTREQFIHMANMLREIQFLYSLQKWGTIASSSSEKSVIEKNDESGQISGNLNDYLIARFVHENKKLELFTSALSINKLLLKISDKASNDDLIMYASISDLQVFAEDILRRKIQKNSTLFHYMGGGKNKDTEKLQSKQIIVYSKNNFEQFEFVFLSGPAHKGDTGLIVPEYNELNADVKHLLLLNSSSVKRFAVIINDVAKLWMLQKYGPIVGPSMRKVRMTAEEEIAKRCRN